LSPGTLPLTCGMHRHLICLAIICATIALTGCMSRAPYQTGPSHDFGKDAAVRSIFAADQAQISDAEIAAALDFDYDPSRARRLAIYGNLPRFDFVTQQNAIFARLQEQLPQLSFVRIPTMLLPRQVNAVQLRSIAARLQADTVLIVELQDEVRYTRHIFARDEGRFAVSLEAYLYDIRSGVIPFADRVEEVLDAVKDRGQEPWQYLQEHRHEIATRLFDRLAERLAAFLHAPADSDARKGD